MNKKISQLILFSLLTVGISNQGVYSGNQTEAVNDPALLQVPNNPPVPGSPNGPGLPPMPIPKPPQLASKSYLLLDYNSGQILVQKDIDMKIEPASLTKLMTAYISFSALKQGKMSLKQDVHISQNAYQASGSRMFIDPRKPVKVEELLRGMIVQSGNDASTALAELVAGTEEGFAQLMNQQAKRLGMKNTNFKNPTGLPDPQHYTTAYDLAILASAIIRDFPEFYPLYSIKEYQYNKIKQPNRNRLLFIDPSVDGMKTGHTDSAGFCLIASARRQDRRLVSVVLGTDSNNARASESQKILNYGFSFYETKKLYAKNQVITQLDIFKGIHPKLKVGFQRDVFMTLQKGQDKLLKATVVSTKPLLAPIELGQKVGSVKITLDEKLVAEYPLVALEKVEEAGFFGRMWDSIKLMFQN